MITIATLVNILILALILWAVIYGLGLFGTPEPFMTVARIVCALIFLVEVLRLLGIATV